MYREIAVGIAFYSSINVTYYLECVMDATERHPNLDWRDYAELGLEDFSHTFFSRNYQLMTVAFSSMLSYLFR